MVHICMGRRWKSDIEWLEAVIKEDTFAGMERENLRSRVALIPEKR